MSIPSLVKFGDLKDPPSVRTELPAPLPLGTRINLALVLRRKHAGRTEEFHVDGEFRVTAVHMDATGGVKQIVTVEAVGVAPCWKAVKGPPKKKLASAKSPRTEVA